LLKVNRQYLVAAVALVTYSIASFIYFPCHLCIACKETVRFVVLFHVFRKSEITYMYDEIGAVSQSL